MITATFCILITSNIALIQYSVTEKTQVESFLYDQYTEFDISEETIDNIETTVKLNSPDQDEEILGWKTEYNIDDLIKEMVKSDLELMKKDKFLKDGGYETLNYHE